MERHENHPVTFKYVVYALLAVVTTFLLHEGLHWITGQLLGYKMIMTLNKAYPQSLVYAHPWHYTLISAVGPLATLTQGMLFFLLLRKTSKLYFYPFLFSAFYLELLSGVMNVSKPNDLGRISQTLGLGLFAIPIIFVAAHFYIVSKTSKREGYSWGFNGLTFFLVLVFSSVWILANQRYHIILIG